MESPRGDEAQERGNASAATRTRGEKGAPRVMGCLVVPPTELVKEAEPEGFSEPEGHEDDHEWVDTVHEDSTHYALPCAAGSPGSRG